MNRVQDLIIQALTTADNNQLRQQAQATIFKLLSQNPTQFFLTCASIVTDSNKQENIRLLAAPVMKTLLAKRTDNGGYYWDLVHVQVRPQIKEILLSNLVSPSHNIMRAGANTIAQIAAIEITRGQWLQIVNALAQNSMHAELNIRRASITTLGYICEQLKMVKSNIKPQTCQQILGSLLIGLMQSGDIVEISLNALRDSISFLRNILESKECCDNVFKYIFPLFNTEYCINVYQILFQFGKYCYHLLGDYMNQIVNLTLQHIRQRNDNSTLALEFWDTIGTEYIKRLHDAQKRVGSQILNLRNFIQELQQILLPQIMGSILIIQKSDLDFTELRQGAVKTLGTFVGCCGREMVDKITQGVSKIILSNNPGERQASALLFSCLVDYVDKDYIEICFTNGFNHLFQLINDTEPIVRKNTLIGFVVLAEFFPDVFLKNKDIIEIINHLFKLSSDPNEQIQILSLNIMISVTDILKSYENHPLATQPDEILKVLIGKFISNLSHNIYKQSNEKLVVLLMNFIISARKKNVITMLISHLMLKYQEYARTKIQDQSIILSQIMSIIHTCMLTLSQVYPSIDMDLKRKVCQIIDLHMSIYGVEPQGINMISAINIYCKNNYFQDQFERYWNFIMQGLEMVDQKATFKACLAAISDIARNDQNKITSHLKGVFQKLIRYMQHNIDRQLKCQILKCFGDLCLGLKNYGEMFIDTIINISNECSDAVYKLSQIQSERDYAEELKESLIEMYHCVIFAQNQSDKINIKLANHLPIISTFIVKTCNPLLRPTIEYIKTCLYLIFDSSLFYSRNHNFKEMVSQIVNSREIANLVDSLELFKDRTDIRDCLIYVNDKIQARRGRK